MSVVSARILRRVVEASRGPEPPSVLLAGVGLPPAPDGDEPPVDADLYYGLLERCGDGDPSLPLRYGDAVQPEDFGAFGLAIKTARDVRDGLERLARYILVVSDTLEYRLVPDGAGGRFVLDGRPAEQRRGVQLANECALAAIVSVLRQMADGPLSPVVVGFRHGAPEDRAAHAAWFGAPVVFDGPEDALHLDGRALQTPARLADEGLSAFLLAQLADQHARRAESAIVHQVRRALTDALCAGLPRRAEIARRLGMSERTLHRRLAEHGCSYQDVVNQVRREVAETLLSRGTHSLAEVAYLTGFSDQSAFQRAFKGWTGQTPRGFRLST